VRLHPFELPVHNLLAARHPFELTHSPAYGKRDLRISRASLREAPAPTATTVPLPSATADHVPSHPESIRTCQEPLVDSRQIQVGVLSNGS
jgi:hypothetical protein